MATLNSYLNILTFLLTTIFYYLVLKPHLTIDIFTNQEKYKEFTKKNNFNLGIYLIIIIIIQFFVNTSTITSNCGGSISQNMSTSFFITFLHWLFIFTPVMLILLIYPGFKLAFSDVIGYFWVSSSANKVLTELLINKDVNKVLNTLPSPKKSPPPSQNPNYIPPPPPSQNPNYIQLGGGIGEDKQKLEDAADIIVKICGNTSILINQLVPSNFEKYWTILNPLMKEKYQNNSSEGIVKKNELFELVVTRDNIGELMWYIYTGILLTSIVQMKIALTKCSTNQATMEKNYQTYLDQEKQNKATQDSATNQIYTS